MAVKTVLKLNFSFLMPRSSVKFIAKISNMAEIINIRNYKTAAIPVKIRSLILHFITGENKFIMVRFGYLPSLRNIAAIL